MENQSVGSANETQKKATIDLVRYVFGFILAVVLTLIAYIIVVSQLLTGFALVGTIMGLAAVQLLVQLIFFLHFGSKQNADAKWHQAAFYFMFLVLVVIVGGSLWIMANLNYNMTMTPEQMNEYMMKESNKGF